MSVSLLLDPLPKPWCNINTNNISTNNETITGNLIVNNISTNNETITGNLTVNGVINDGNTQIGSGYVSVFGTPTGPTGINMIYGLTTDPSSTAYLIGGNTNSFNHKFHGGGQSDPVRFTINAQGAVNTMNNTLDDGSGNSIIASNQTINGNIISNGSAPSFPNGTNRQIFNTLLLPSIGGTPFLTTTFHFSRIGDTVNVSFATPATINRLSTTPYFISNDLIPSLYTPLTNPGTIAISAIVNGTAQPAQMTFSPDGEIRLYPDFAQGTSGSFFPNGSTGFLNGSGSYSIY